MRGLKPIRLSSLSAYIYVYKVTKNEKMEEKKQAHAAGGHFSVHAKRHVSALLEPSLKGTSRYTRLYPYAAIAN